MKFALFLLGAAAYQALVGAASQSNIVNIDNEFDVEIPEHQLTVLSCPTGRGLTITNATWVATRYMDIPGQNAIVFERTKDVIKLCRGLNNCVLKPVAHLEQVEDGMYIFFGLPIENAKYKLKVTGICEKTPVAPIGREMISVIDSNEELVMGCNEGEVINVSLLRGAGLQNSLIYRNLYCTNSFMENAFELCQNKRSCKISKSLYNSDNGKCIYQVIDAQYYCRPPHHHYYIDVIKHSDGKYETVLTAEENSHVVVKAPAESVLSVKSAIWDVVGKSSEEDDPKRNRLDTLQFYCEGRSSCTFIPKRASNGMMDLYLGGITGDIKKPFMLRATFEFVPHDPEKVDKSNIKTVKCRKGSTIEMTCPEKTFLRVVSALWGGFVSNKSLEPTVIFWEEKNVQGKLYRVTEIGALLDKQIFNKNHYVFDPVAVVNGKQRLPFITGVSGDDHNLTVNYMCMDKYRSPSISDIGVRDNIVKRPTDDNMDMSLALEKEKVLDSLFKKDDQLVIMVEHKADSVIKVGDFLKIQIPYETDKHYITNITDERETMKRSLSEKCDSAIINIIFADDKTLHITTNFYHKNKLVDTIEHEVTSTRPIEYGRNVKDIVVANGGVVGMRVFIKSNSESS
ncbi:phosphoglycolate phosphatase, putative [Babesia ovis]|uniref:Phosphoglycolate phosphatase, putative n=1 Tax=Babesia ovis TaxID=5869 RepID=A0A9W5TC17_BABOV|nr:phosphoglycolate phosphatase, putative [Babesia ovis]